LGPTGGAQDRGIYTNLESLWIVHANDRVKRANSHAPLASRADIEPGDQKVTGVYLRLVTRDGSDTPANLPQVFDQLRRDSSIVVAQPKEEIGTLFAIVSNVNRVFLAIAGAVALSSALAIMLALYNSMEQRKRQIAIMRVLGASAQRVMQLVLTESAVIGLVGALLGVGLGLVFARVAAGIVKTKLGIVIDPSPTPIIVLSLVMGSVLLACAAGILPALVAYRATPAQNLKPAA
jgi:putative ABC transport system permease protein